MHLLQLGTEPTPISPCVESLRRGTLFPAVPAFFSGITNGFSSIPSSPRHRLRVQRALRLLFMLEERKHLALRGSASSILPPLSPDRACCTPVRETDSTRKSAVATFGTIIFSLSAQHSAAFLLLKISYTASRKPALMPKLKRKPVRLRQQLSKRPQQIQDPLSDSAASAPESAPTCPTAASAPGSAEKTASSRRRP